MGPVPNHRPFSMLKLSTGSAKNKEELADFMSETNSEASTEGTTGTTYRAETEPNKKDTDTRSSQTKRFRGLRATHGRVITPLSRLLL